jgi:hypothetical protein
VYPTVTALIRGRGGVVGECIFLSEDYALSESERPYAGTCVFDADQLTAIFSGGIPLPDSPSLLDDSSMDEDNDVM